MRVDGGYNITSKRFNHKERAREESQRRLNYYSRSSPKKKKNHTHFHSPLLSYTRTPPFRRNHHPHIRLQPASVQSSFRLDVHEFVLSTSCHEILIEESDEEEILIEEEAVQLPHPPARVIISPQKRVQPQIFTQTPPAQHPKPLFPVNNEIRIQDDQNIQVEEQEAEPPHNHEANVIRIKNQQLEDTQKTMNRQFTFGLEFVEAQKAKIEALPLPTTHQEDQYSSPATSARPEKETQGLHEDISYFQSNMEYEAEQRRKPELDLDLVKASSSFNQLYDDYQSPKFNAVPLVKSDDKWIAAKDYHFLTAPKRKKRAKS